MAILGIITFVYYLGTFGGRFALTGLGQTKEVGNISNHPCDVI